MSVCMCVSVLLSFITYTPHPSSVVLMWGALVSFCCSKPRSRGQRLEEEEALPYKNQATFIYKYNDAFGKA